MTTPHLSRPVANKTLLEDQTLDTEKTTRSPHRWAVVLAGGDGVRLRGLTRLICGDDRPKQFCPLIGECTLLDQARKRAERSIRPEQTLFAVTKAHEDYYLRDLAQHSCHRIVQPTNRGTAPPILYSLLHISQIDPKAVVAVLPCDHYYSDEGAFTKSLESAFEIAAIRSQSVVLFGAKPSAPEVEYGWIEVGRAVHGELLEVQAFHEKPPRSVAECLLRTGALWNTFVMVGHVRAFLDMAWAAVPGVLEVFRRAVSTVHHNAETRIPDSLYDWVSPSDFSRQVLSPAARRLVALRLENLEWHDLGDPDRVMSALLNGRSELPAWVGHWQARRKAAGTATPVSKSAVA